MGQVEGAERGRVFGSRLILFRNLPFPLNPDPQQPLPVPLGHIVNMSCPGLLVLNHERNGKFYVAVMERIKREFRKTALE